MQEEVEKLRWQIRDLSAEVSRLKSEVEEAQAARREAVSKVSRAHASCHLPI
jgi:outer membrane murein-binding lipoprotein Lpp